MKKYNLKFWKGISKKWFSGFLPNLFAVIIGIMLTFGISSIIQHNNEKKDVKEMMTLIKKELNENKQWLRLRIQVYKDESKAFQKILTAKTDGNLRNIPADSLVQLIQQIQNITESFISANAWDIFKNSETITKFHNKSLIIQLAECYYWLDNARESMAMYYKEKTDAYIYFDYEAFPYDYVDALFANEKSKTFVLKHINFYFYNIEINFTLFINIIDYTLYLIEKDENSDENIIDYDTFAETIKN
ncbi:MAG: hypothetical protein LBT27_06595 [Prevotellaceae bacterium]|jgi:uncharacterized FlaG/YvyC family protein|nr:hypothetical protein [Prevotellaceae bacterium]